MTVELVLFCCVFGLFIMASYTLGLRNGQKLARKEEVKMPNLNPIEIVNNQIEKHEERKEQSVIDIMMENINNYDGTGIGQQDIPD